MSIADRFGTKPDAGFVRAYEARAARRQFQISIALILVLAFAFSAVGVFAELAKP